MPDFPEHEDRAAVLAELHLRPFLQFTSPHLFQHFAFMIDPHGAADEHAAFSALCQRLGVATPAPGARFHHVKAGDWTLRWELHSEFASYDWSLPEASASSLETDVPLPEAFTGYKPAGRLMVRIAIALVPQLDNPEAIERYFDRTSLAVVKAAQGGARVATDFQADKAGTVRFLIEDLGLTPTRAGRLVQRVLELETYRTLALLGLPLARRAEPTVRHVEEELLRLSAAMGEAGSAAANRHLLQQLTALSARLEALIASTAYRFGATRAYAELVRGRLDVIREEDHGGYVSFTRFLRRRFSPAIATCEAVDRRQQKLAERLAHAVDLLRTRIQSELEPEPAAARLHEPTQPHAAPPAADGRRPLHRGGELLHRRPARLCRQGHEGSRRTAPWPDAGDGRGARRSLRHRRRVVDAAQDAQGLGQQRGQKQLERCRGKIVD